MKRTTRMAVLLLLFSLTLLINIGIGAAAEKTVLTLPELGYSEDSLEPYISRQTMELHYGKHHKGYVDKANRFLSGTRFEYLPLLQIMMATKGDPDKEDIYNNVSQAWNHSFFWKCLKPHGAEPGPKMLSMIEESFGSMEDFKKEFSAAAASQFGSGWVWLVQDGDHLRIMSTPNADNPATEGYNPLLVMDVWEHAYYLDYQNRRTEFISKCLDNIIDWTFVEKNLN